MARGINDSGWIVGQGTLDGVAHSFILATVPEAPAPLMYFAGLSVIGSLALRRRSGGR